MAAVADWPPSQDPEVERQRLGAIHCLEGLTAGRGLPAFDCQLTDGAPLVGQGGTSASRESLGLRAVAHLRRVLAAASSFLCAPCA
eukprot:3405883-Alexandrium_andersonii.AAC.1